MIWVLAILAFVELCLLYVVVDGLIQRIANWLADERAEGEREP